MVGIDEYADQRAQARDKPGSAVEVLEVGADEVLLDLPESIQECDRRIPQDAIEFGDEARAWFAWDLETKQPRAPHDGYAGTVKWGRENVSMMNRVGGTYSDVLEALNSRTDGFCDESWRWDGEESRELFPMLIVPHADFSPDPGLVLIDLDDVVNPRGDGTGVMTREAWDIIQSFAAYAELSTSMTGVHVLVRGRIPGFVDGKQVMKDLEDAGHAEIRGYPGNGRIIGTTWAHIAGTPMGIPDAQDAVDALAESLIDGEEQLSDEEQTQKAFDEAQKDAQRFTGGSSNRSKYYDLNPERIANTGPYASHGSNGRGPHPHHGGTSTPDAESTNFAVSRCDGWVCFAHDDDGGGALQLIAVLEEIRCCGNASGVMDDAVDALRTCLAARDKYSNGSLDDVNPPTAALKGVLEVQGMEYPDDGRLPRHKFEAARRLYDEMRYTG